MSSDTVVFQSFRTRDVPPWIDACMASVRGWCERRGLVYDFMDDAFLELVPEWYARKADHHIYLVADLARLVAAQRHLDRGFRRAVWIDADVLIFDPDRFDLDVRSDHAFCAEVWIMMDGAGVERAHRRVNNAISVYDRDNPFLPFYLHACQQIVRNLPSPVPPLSVSTRFLTELHPQLGFELVPNAGLLSPHVQAALHAGLDTTLRLLMEQHGGPLYAANLCAHFRDRETGGVCLSDEDFETTVEQLLRSGGESLNRLCAPDRPRSFHVSPRFEPDTPRSRYLWGS
jgi:hypothetical protein